MSSTNLRIRMNPFEREPRFVRRKVARALKRTAHSGQFILGREVESFEREWSEFNGSQYSVGVGNGLDALTIGLRALGIGPGDEVITTPMTAFATILAIKTVGAEPVLADIEWDTALMSIDDAQSKITPRTRAIVFVHLYGRAGNMAAWQQLAAEAGIHLVEDCAQAHGAAIGEQRVGTFGSFGAFSFYPTKNLGALGDGGLLVTNDEDLASEARLLRNYGQRSRYEHVRWGYNSRLDEIQAAVLRVKLPYLESNNRRRREIADSYRRALTAHPTISVLEAPKLLESHVNHLFVVRTENRKGLMEFLARHSVDSLSHYPISANLQPPMTKRATALPMPYSELHSEQCVSLPISPWLRNSEVDRVCELLAQYRG